MNGPSHGYQPGPGFGLEQAATNGGGQVEAETNGGGEAGEGAKFSDINLILDQILTMSDQNIDEAQVFKIISFSLEENQSVLFYNNIFV